MLKRIFEERRYVVAAVGGLIAVQGIIFTLIDVGFLSVSLTMVGLAAVVGGLHVEAMPLLTKMVNGTSAYLARVKVGYEQSKEAERARHDEARQLQKRRERASAKMSVAETEADESEVSPILLNEAETPADAPESLAEQEFNPFANLVEAQSATNAQTPVPFYAPIPQPPFIPVIQSPPRAQCPYCGELIPTTAIKCRYCNEFLDGRSRSPQQSVMQFEPSHPLGISTTETSAEYDVWSSHPKMFRDSPVSFLISCALIPVFGLGLVILILWWLSCLNTTLIVTNRRTTLRTGILSKHTREVRHNDVRYLEVHQSFFGRIFGVGSLAISSAGQCGLEIGVSGISAPQDVKDMIDGYR